MPRVWINGKLFDKADAKVSVYDHGLLYGDGVFEGIRIYAGKVFRIREHVDRLYDSAVAISLEIPMSREAMADAIVATVKANDKHEGYIRLVVTRGPGSLGIDPRRCDDPQVIIIVDDISLYPSEVYERGLEVITASITRNHPNALNPRIKSLNYLNNILAKMEATRAGCQEAIMLNGAGEVAECTGDNIFIVKNRVVRTPPTEAGILEGITRGAVIRLAKQAGLTVVEGPFTRHDIYAADECFLTGTAAEVVSVISLDGRTIGDGKPGPVTKDLLERFRELTRKGGW